MASEIMADMTDEEYDALDEYLTKNPPKVDPSKARYIAPKGEHTVKLDDFSADYINAHAEAAHNPPQRLSQIWCGKRLPKMENAGASGAPA
ncbi:MAG: hypothetical protein LBK74_11495 [Treponema sp.]|jgi:hypothetical protein|nr:hypothetical protein [Treponema sp.]